MWRWNILKLLDVVHDEDFVYRIHKYFTDETLIGRVNREWKLNDQNHQELIRHKNIMIVGKNEVKAISVEESEKGDWDNVYWIGEITYFMLDDSFPKGFSLVGDYNFLCLDFI